MNDWRKHWRRYQYWHYQTRPVISSWTQILVPFKLEAWFYRKKRTEPLSEEAILKFFNSHRIQIRHNMTRMLRPCVGCTVVTSISWRNQMTVRTVHELMKWILNPTHSTDRLTRWSSKLPEFEIYVSQRACVEHQAPDALSCLFTSGKDNTSLEDDLPLPEIETVHNLGFTQVCVINTTNVDVLSLDNEKNGVSLDPLPTESEFCGNERMTPIVKLQYYK